MDWLKKLLNNDEVYNAVIKALGDKKIHLEDGSRIPKDRLDAEITKVKSLEDQLTKQKESYETQIKDVNAKLSSLSESVKENEQLKTDLNKIKSDSELKLTEIETQRIKDKETYEAELSSIKLNASIDTKLLALGAKNEASVKAAKANMDISKISLEGENLLGFDDQFKPIKETLPDLFGEKKIEGTPPTGGGNTPNGGDDFYTKEQINAMSQSEIQKNLEKVNKSMANIN